MEKLAKSWLLAPTDSAEVSAVDEEHVVMAKVRLSLWCALFVFRKIPLTKHLGHFSNPCSCVESYEIEAFRFYPRKAETDLKVEPHKWEKTAAKYKCNSEKLKKENGVLRPKRQTWSAN